MKGKVIPFGKTLTPEEYEEMCKIAQESFEREMANQPRLLDLIPELPVHRHVTFKQHAKAKLDEGLAEIKYEYFSTPMKLSAEDAVSLEETAALFGITPARYRLSPIFDPYIPERLTAADPMRVIDPANMYMPIVRPQPHICMDLAIDRELAELQDEIRLELRRLRARRRVTKRNGREYRTAYGARMARLNG
jgi:hypothetical protein